MRRKKPKMNIKPQVSIIVPVFNGEKYLSQCIDSVLAQSYTDWELLLIDDGSTDGAAALCDSYAADPRIVVVHQPNSGTAAARNKGISMANGEWVAFVDSDDWVEPDMLGSMVDMAQRNDADVVVCGYVEEYVNRQKRVAYCEQETVLDSADGLKMLLEGKIGSYFYTMLFRKAVMQEPVFALKVFEDHATLFKWVAKARRMVISPSAFYHYRQAGDSLIHSNSHEASRDFFLALKERYYYIEQHHLLPGWKRENRHLYLSGCIKYAKDLARMDNYGPVQRQMISEVRDELRKFLPVGWGELSIKNCIRLKLLMANADVFVRLLRCSSLFAFGKRHKEQGMY